MKRTITLFLISFLLLQSFLYADEGMWLLSSLDKNYSELEAAGFKLSVEDVYSINKSSVKDAIVGLGSEGRDFRHFCSGGIISDKGLFITNHHCGYGLIQNHSSLENDYLKNGFWAYSLDEELTNEGITASVLVRMEDVSEKILSKLNDEMTEKERNEMIKTVSDELIKEATEDTYYSAKVYDMFNNNQYFLFLHTVYKDVRLVGAPPSSLGKFGGDTDNWMWPRHTADFTLFRIYTAPDGSPASYSAENIPLKPKHHLPVSVKGVEENDFAMIIGFPGTTNRYLTSYGLDETMNVVNKLRHDIRTVKLDIIREDMIKDDKVRIQYASKFAGVANYWKYSIEQNKALAKLNTMQTKKEIENNFHKWVEKDATRKSKYGDALKIIEKVYSSRKDIANARMYVVEGLLSGPELPNFAYRNNSLIEVLNSKDEEKINEAIESAKESAKDFYKNFNPETEKKVIAAMYKYVFENIDKQYLPSIFDEINKSFKGDFDAFAEQIFSKSVFANEDAFSSFLEKPNAKKLEKDIALRAGVSVMEKFKEINAEFRSLSTDLARGERLFADALLQINKEELLYPDANSSIRFTNGTVGGYIPADGVVYDYYTTIDGVMQKEDPNSHEFYLTDRFKELYNNKDFGDYLNEKGELVTCFLTNNDITGGNSGSAVMDAHGRLIGVAFDGNSEAMSGDIHFETELQKCINVDIRYVLWVIDKYANAKNLINEMTIVK